RQVAFAGGVHRCFASDDVASPLPERCESVVLRMCGFDPGHAGAKLRLAWEARLGLGRKRFKARRSALDHPEAVGPPESTVDTLSDRKIGLSGDVRSRRSSRTAASGSQPGTYRRYS